MSLKTQAIKGVKWSGISILVVNTLHFITITILARLLQPSDFGLMSMVFVVIGFAKLFSDMGISNSIIFRQNASKEELSSLYWLNILAGIIIFFLVCLSTPLIIFFYHEPRLNNLIYLASLVFLITPFGQQFQVLLKKELKFKSLSRIEITSTLINSIVTIILAFNGTGVFSLIWGQLAGTSSRVLLLLSLGWRQWKPSWHFSKKNLKGYISFGLYQMGEKAVNYFNLNLDYLLIGSLLGAKSLGYYTLAHNLILKPLSKINPIITRVAFPVFSKVQNNTNKLKKGFLKVIQLLSSMNFPIMVGMAVVAPVAVPVVFGKQWLPSVTFIQILTVVGLFRSISNPVGSLLLAKGRADLSFKWNVALTIIQIPGLYLGIKLGGVFGVAIAFAILSGVYTIFNYLILICKLIGPCLREYISIMWPFLWMSILMGFMISLIGLSLKSLPQLILLVTQIIFGVAIYFILMIYRQRNFVIEIKEML